MMSGSRTRRSLRSSSNSQSPVKRIRRSANNEATPESSKYRSKERLNESSEDEASLARWRSRERRQREAIKEKLASSESEEEPNCSKEHSMVRRTRKSKTDGDEKKKATKKIGKRTRRQMSSDDEDLPQGEYRPSFEDKLLVKEEYARVALEYDELRKTEGLKAWNDYHERLPKVIVIDEKQKEKLIQLADLHPQAQPTSQLSGVLKVVSLKDDHPVQEVPFIPLPSGFKYLQVPPMMFWTHTEKNIRAEDERALSHIPFIGETDEDLAFGEELMDDFEEGIHGVREGWGRYLNDWMLYRILKTLEARFMAIGRNREDLHRTIHYLFPNKCTVRQLATHIHDFRPRLLISRTMKPVPANSHLSPIRPSLCQLSPRSPISPKSRGIKEGETFLHSIEAVYCPRCCCFDCQTHGLVDEGRVWKKSCDLPEREPDSKERIRADICGSECYKLDKSWKSAGSHQGKGRPPKTAKLSLEIVGDLEREAVKFPENHLFLEAHFKKLALDRDGAHNSCKLAKLVKIYVKKTDFKMSCKQMFNFLRSHGIPEFKEQRVEEPEPERKRRDQHQTFRSTRHKLGEVSISHQVQPCNHPGKKCEEGICACLRDNNVCTKYCQCEDCPHKFPGCKCAAGKCNTRQCACFLANFECDPDLCKECGAEFDVESCIEGSSSETVTTDREPSAEADEDDSKRSDSKERELDEKKKRKNENVKSSSKLPPSCTNVQLQRHQQKKLLVGVSDIAGWGCFVDENVKRGELISEYCGEVISVDECERRGRIYDRIGCSYIFKLNDEQAVDATRIGNAIRFANHCDEPNCVPRVMIVNGMHRIGIYARKEIRAGEEIFFNYSYERVQKIQFVGKRRRRNDVDEEELKRRLHEDYKHLHYLNLDELNNKANKAEKEQQPPTRKSKRLQGDSGDEQEAIGDDEEATSD